MELNEAIIYIRNWRKQQNLEALTSQKEREAASRLLIDKGYKLPEFVPDATGKLSLNQGVYVQETVELSVVESLAEVEENTPNSQSLDPNPLYPWTPDDKREFWCEKLQSCVRLTGDLDENGTYWAIKSGEGNFRRWPVKGHELVLKENAPQEATTSELLLINSASWGDIKNCLVGKFIPSYPWSKKGERSPTQIREDMLNLAKSRKQGLASFIEEERKQGRFEDPQNFIMRMNIAYESFPWGDFVRLIDFD